jgi:hypothetical protein
MKENSQETFHDVRSFFNLYVYRIIMDIVIYQKINWSFGKKRVRENIHNNENEVIVLAFSPSIADENM